MRMESIEKSTDNALSGFDAQMREVDKQEAIEQAKENLLTHKYLLGHCERTIKILINDGYIEVKERISAKDQEKFEQIIDLIRGGSKYKDKLTKAQQRKLDTKVLKFFCFIIVKPKFTPEEIDVAFTAVEKNDIFLRWLESQLSGTGEKAVTYFRSITSRPGIR